MTRARGLVGFAALLVFDACLIPDLSSLTSDGGLDVNVTDATTDAMTEAATTDAKIDSPKSDAIAADALSACGHTFCDNFDEDAGPAFSKWDNVNATGGTLSLTSDAFTLPNALNAALAAGPQGAGPSLDKNFSNASHVHVEVDLKGDCLLNEADVVSISLTTPPSGYQSVAVVVYESPAGSHMALQYITDAGEFTDAADISLGNGFQTWSHFALDLDFGQQQFKVTRTADAGPVVTSTPLNPTVPQGATSLQVGILYHAANAAGCGVQIDDVIVDTTP